MDSVYVFCAAVCGWDVRVYVSWVQVAARWCACSSCSAPLDTHSLDTRVVFRHSLMQAAALERCFQRAKCPSLPCIATPSPGLLQPHVLPTDFTTPCLVRLLRPPTPQRSSRPRWRATARSLRRCWLRRTSRRWSTRRSSRRGRSGPRRSWARWTRSTRWADHIHVAWCVPVQCHVHWHQQVSSAVGGGGRAAVGCRLGPNVAHPASAAFGFAAATLARHAAHRPPASSINEPPVCLTN